MQVHRLNRRQAVLSLLGPGQRCTAILHARPGLGHTFGGCGRFDRGCDGRRVLVLSFVVCCYLVHDDSRVAQYFSWDASLTADHRVGHPWLVLEASIPNRGVSMQVRRRRQ